MSALMSEKSKVKKVVVSWVGKTDITAVSNNDENGSAILTLLGHEKFDEIHILSFGFENKEIFSFKEFVEKSKGINVFLHTAELSNPTDYKRIYDSERTLLNNLKNKFEGKVHISALLTSGTPAMFAMWVVLSQQGYPVRLIQTRKNEDKRYFVEELSPDDLNEKTVHSVNLPKGPIMSKELKRTYSDASLIAGKNIDVLIHGETGVGKELLAQHIHAKSGRKGNIVCVNCGAIPKELFESIFFGHEKGAFTSAINSSDGIFVKSNNGTLFLDEVGELSLDMQVKLLRVLEEKKVTKVGGEKSVPVVVRIVAATNRNLISMVNDGSFRKDLYFRIAGITLQIPPLREWDDESFEKIVSHELEAVCKIERMDYVLTISSAARDALRNYPWQGNIRELKSVLKRLAILARGKIIEVDDVMPSLLFPFVEAKSIDGNVFKKGFDVTVYLDEVKKDLVIKALIKTNNRVSEASKLLGLPQGTFSNWKKKFCG